MKKIDSLRAALVAACPAFADDPDRLVIFVDKGRLVSRLTASDMMGGVRYEWRYVVRLEFHDFTGSPDEIAVPLLLWLGTHQPDRLLDFAREDTALGFAADIIDQTTWDIVFSFELNEAIQVTPRVSGGWNVVTLPEPAIAGTGLIAGMTGEIPLAELVARATP